MSVQTKEEIIEFFEDQVVDESVDPDIADRIFDAAEKALYNNRDWWFLRTRDTQSTNRTANADFVSYSATLNQLTMVLPDNFLRPLEDRNNGVAFILVNGLPYLLVDRLAQEFAGGSYVFIDWESESYTLHPAPPESQTITINYIKKHPTITGTGTPLIPEEFRELIAYIMGSKYAALESGNDSTANEGFVSLIRGEGKDLFDNLAMMNEKILTGGAGLRRAGISNTYTRR